MTSIAAVIAWIASNPAIIAQGAQAVIDMVQAAIAAFQRHSQGTMTDAQLQAEWTALGVDLAAVEARANAAGL